MASCMFDLTCIKQYLNYFSHSVTESTFSGGCVVLVVLYGRCKTRLLIHSSQTRYSAPLANLILGDTRGLLSSNSPTLTVSFRINLTLLTVASQVADQALTCLLHYPSPFHPGLFLFLKHRQLLPAPGSWDVCSLSLENSYLLLQAQLSSFLSNLHQI